MLIKPLKILIKGVLLLLLVLVLVGLILPQSYSVNKTIEINANIDAVKPLITDFNQWQKWSPWEKVDPSIRFTLGEPSSGLGAHQSWKGKWGYGEMIITSVNQNKGQTTAPLISGYTAILSEYVLRNTVSMGLNNLKTVAQLSHSQRTMHSHASQDSTSEN